MRYRLFLLLPLPILLAGIGIVLFSQV